MEMLEFNEFNAGLGEIERKEEEIRNAGEDLISKANLLKDIGDIYGGVKKAKSQLLNKDYTPLIIDWGISVLALSPCTPNTYTVSNILKRFYRNLYSEYLDTTESIMDRISDLLSVDVNAMEIEDIIMKEFPPENLFNTGSYTGNYGDFGGALEDKVTIKAKGLNKIEITIKHICGSSETISYNGSGLENIYGNVIVYERAQMVSIRLSESELRNEEELRDTIMDIIKNVVPKCKYVNPNVAYRVGIECLTDINGTTFEFATKEPIGAYRGRKLQGSGEVFIFREDGKTGELVHDLLSSITSKRESLSSPTLVSTAEYMKREKGEGKNGQNISRI